jgi:hypothetical protein
MLIRRLKKWWAAQDHDWTDPLAEGWYADQYRDPAIRERIIAEYQKRHCSGPTPFTHPEQFDPLDPPRGYRYDPYYELWIKTQ